MTFSYSEFLQLAGLYFYPFVRISAMFAIIPIFSSRSVSVKFKLMLTVFITLAIAPSLALPPPVDPFTWQGVMFISQQILIGLAMGLIF